MAESGRRRWRKAKQKSYEGRRDEDAAREIDRQINKAFRRRWAARGVLVLALVVAVQHWFAHIGEWATGWQDVLVGYPTAALLAIVGLFLLPRTPGPN